MPPSSSRGTTVGRHELPEVDAIELRWSMPDSESVELVLSNDDPLDWLADGDELPEGDGDHFLAIVDWSGPFADYEVLCIGSREDCEREAAARLKRDDRG